MRLFELHRDHDVSGVSGTGVVADGVVFPDGAVAIRWRGDKPSTVVFEDLGDAEAIHGHDGATRFVFLDDPPKAPFSSSVKYEPPRTPGGAGDDAR